jgi:ParB/RepB/Spo0J family partition protein
MPNEGFNARTDYDEDYIKSLKVSIMESGLLQPVGVTQANRNDIDDNKQYYLVYGFCRFKAIELIRAELGEDAYSVLDVVLNDGTTEELRDRNLKENIDRKNLKPHEIANAIKKMANSGLEQRDIAKRLGRPQSWVSYHYKAATKLGPAATKAFESGDLTLEQALNIADVPEDAQEDVVTKVLGADTRSEARKVAKQASKEAGTRRTYANKGRPTAKNLAQFVSDASFDADADVATARDKAFYNGLAAGMRVALGDLDFENLKPGDSHTDMDFHAKARKEKEAKAKKSAKKKTAKKTAKAKATKGAAKKKSSPKKKKAPAAESETAAAG